MRARVLLLFLFLLAAATEAAASPRFSLLTAGSSQPIRCALLEIHKDEALCTSDGMLMRITLDQVVHVEVAGGGVSRSFQGFTPEAISTINAIAAPVAAAEIAGSAAGVERGYGEYDRWLSILPEPLSTWAAKVPFRPVMNAQGITLLLCGLILLVIGGLLLLIAAFRESLLWGLGCLLLPVVALVFVAVYWRESAKAVLISVVGAGALVASVALPDRGGAAHRHKPARLNHSYTPKAAAAAAGLTKRPQFHCAGKVYCSQMSSCAEARFYLRNCPNTKMDGDGDGIPCERQWCH